jgi:arylsulfatase A-like enzyme
MPARDLEHVIALYDGEIRFTDDTIKQILEKLAARGRSGNTVVIITGDHGDGFFEHGVCGHQTTLFDEVVRVPLILWWPDRIPASARIVDQARIIDVMPTILSLAGIPPLGPMQGRDLTPLMDGEALPAQPALLELLCRGQRLRGVRTNEYKLLVDERTGQAGLFHLAADPAESVLVSADGVHGKEVDALLANLRRVVDESETWRNDNWGGSRRASRIDGQLLRRLRSLGYVGGNGDDD